MWRDSFVQRRTRHPSADFATPRFTSALPNFSRCCPIAFAHDVSLLAGVNDRRVPVVQLREQARGLPMTRSSN
jgi:hypothetical protein